jgi:hypothetical protein
MKAITRRRWRRVSAMVVFVALAIVARGAFASFVGSTTANHAAGLATMQIELGGSNPDDDQFTIAATDVVVGDSIWRIVKLTPTGTVAPTEIDLATNATTSSLLDTDTTNGLYTEVFTCSVPIDYVLVGGFPSLTGCQGAFANPVPLQPVIFGATNLSSVSLTPGTPTYLGIALTLAGHSGNDNVFKSLTSVIRYSFRAVQPAGSAR